MENKFRQRLAFLVSFLAICFFVGLVFSGYYELSEMDIFSPLCFENQDLNTLTTIEKVKFSPPISYFEQLLPPVFTSFQISPLVLPISLDSQIIRPIRC